MSLGGRREKKHNAPFLHEGNWLQPQSDRIQGISLSSVRILATSGSINRALQALRSRLVTDLRIPEPKGHRLEGQLPLT